jgi:hypothetical protein
MASESPLARQRAKCAASFLLAALTASVVVLAESASSSRGASKTAQGSELDGTTPSLESQAQSLIPTINCPQFCGNGRCDPATGLCKCYPGWRGDECHLCGGKIK